MNRENLPSYTGPERRAADKARIEWEARMHRENSARFEAIETKQREMGERQDVMAAELSENTQATHEGNADVKTLLAIVQGGRKGIRFGMSIGRTLNILAKWGTPIIVFVTAIWALLHGRMPGSQ